MKKLLIILLIVIVVLVAGIFFFDNQENKVETDSEDPLTIGVLIPLTGEGAITGEKIREGASIAAKELEEMGATIVFEDSEGTAKDGLTAAKKLIEVDEVDVIVGTYNPSTVLAVAPYAAEKGVSIFSYSFCSKAYAEHENVFCGYPDAEEQLRTVFDYIKESGATKMATIVLQDDFGFDSAAAMESGAEELGYEIVHQEVFPIDTKDLRTPVTKAISSGADILFSAADPINTLTVAKLYQELGGEGPRITFVDVDNENLKSFGESVEGTLAPGIAPNEFDADFVEAFVEDFGQQPDYPSALGYDVLKYVGLALNENGTENANQSVLNYAYNDSAISNFKYKNDRTVSYDLELWTVRGGEYEGFYE